MLKSHPLLPYGECETFQYIKTFTKNWIRKPTGKDFLEGVSQGAGLSFCWRQPCNEPKRVKGRSGEDHDWLPTYFSPTYYVSLLN